MMSETESGNVRIVHESAISPNPEFSKRPLEWFLGKVAKIALQTANSRVEHIWILVIDIEGDDLIGKIDNDPVDLEGMKFGDPVRLRRTEISHVEEVGRRDNERF